MTNKKTTKQQLVASIVLLFMCFSMLLGTTFAWFTDSVTSSGNIIKTGTLDVEMYYADGTKAVPTDDDAWTSADGVAIYKADQLWEPGYTDAKHIKIKNKGTLALKYQVAILPTGEVSDLAEVIDVYLYDGATQIADRDLDETKNVGTLADVIKTGIAKGDLDATAAYTMTIVLKMQETAGNEYQDKSIGDDFTIQLLATQYTAENDSFDDQYDVNAPFSLWNGVVPTEMPATLVVDGVTQTIHVKDAAAFAYLSTLSAKWVELYTDGNGREWTNYANGAGADYYYSDKWTVCLDADIDLGNYVIAPVDIKLGESTGASAFNGNGHTIRNINTTTGLFADKARTSFSNLTLENVKATNGALIGSSDHNISNVTVKNAKISGADYVGGLVGYAYGAVNGCQVIDSSVVATGKEAGGLAGYVVTSREEATVASNVVRNVSVYAGNRAAGLVAQVNVKVKVYNNTVDTVTVGAEDTSTYQPNAVVSNALDAANVYDNTAVNANVLGTINIVDKPADLKDAVNNAQSGDTLVLGDGEYTLPTLANKEGVTIDGADGAVIGGESASTGFGSNFGKNTTIKNVDFSGASNGVRYSYANGGTTTFENCTFAGDSTYGFHIDESKGATFIFNNCTFSGFNAFAGDLVKVVFNNCTFLHNGNYGHTNIWSVAEFNNCTFGDKASVGQGNGSGAKLYFNGVEESYHHEYVGSAESLFAFAESVNVGNDAWNGQAVIIVADIDLENALWTPIGQTGATQFKGTFDGHGYTIKNLNVDASKQTGANYSSGLFGWLNNATVKNLTVENATVAGNHNVGVIAGYMETAGCTISNCHVVNATVIAKHANDDACGDKVGVIVGHAGNAGVVVENCSAKDSTVVAGRDAGQIAGAAKAANVTGCTAENVTVTAGGDCTGANVNNTVIGREL